MANTRKANETLSDILEGKNIVIDTSSLLVAGVDLLNVIHDTTLVIPAVVVKELETKRTHASVGFMAREWLRLIERTRVEFGKELCQGVELAGYKNVTLRIEPNHSNQESLPRQLQDGSNDSTILAVAKNLSVDTDVKGDVVVMSNDVPLLIHATVELGLPAYEYSNADSYGTQVYLGRYEIEVTENDLENITGNEKHALTKWKKVVFDLLPEDHAKSGYVIAHLPRGAGNAMRFLYTSNSFEYAPKHGVPISDKAKNIVTRSHEQSIALTYLKKSAEEMPIVSLGGGAGSGKTLLAISEAINALEKKKYQRIMAFRSLHEMGEGQEMGFLPGDVDEKMGPWAGAIFDAMEFLATKSKGGQKDDRVRAEAIKAEVRRLKEMVEVSPITYLRGRSIANTFLIVEEAQNFSLSELLNILSRVGEGSKIVFTWDSAQVDNKFLQSGNRADIWALVDLLKGEESFGHITLAKSERSKVAALAARILETKR